jgi:hypothetical protein
MNERCIKGHISYNLKLLYESVVCRSRKSGELFLRRDFQKRPAGIAIKHFDAAPNIYQFSFRSQRRRACAKDQFGVSGDAYRTERGSAGCWSLLLVLILGVLEHFLLELL